MEELPCEFAIPRHIEGCEELGGQSWEAVLGLAGTESAQETQSLGLLDGKLIRRLLSSGSTRQQLLFTAASPLTFGLLSFPHPLRLLFPTFLFSCPFFLSSSQTLGRPPGPSRFTCSLFYPCEFSLHPNDHQIPTLQAGHLLPWGDTCISMSQKNEIQFLSCGSCFSSGLPSFHKGKTTSRFTLNSFHSLPSSVHCRSSLCLLRKETPTHPFSLYLLQGPVLSPRLIPVQSPLTLPDKPGNGLFPPHTQGPNGPQPLPLLLTAPYPPTLRSCLQACPVPAPTQATPSIHS